MTLNSLGSGKNKLIQAIVRDSTDRVRNEIDIKETNELLSIFIKNSPIYAFIKEVTGKESRVLKASEN